jgi:hypothetical protein
MKSRSRAWLAAAVKVLWKLILGVMLGLAIAAGAVLYWSGLWREIPRRRHFQSVLQTADLNAATLSAIGVVQRCGTNSTLVIIKKDPTTGEPVGPADWRRLDKPDTTQPPAPAPSRP